MPIGVPQLLTEMGRDSFVKFMKDTNHQIQKVQWTL